MTTGKLMKISHILGSDQVRIRYLQWQFILNNFHEVFPEERKDFPSHIHKGFELIVPSGRQYRCRLGHRELTVPNGHFLLIQPGQAHIDHYAPEERFFCIHFMLRSESTAKMLLRLFVPGLPPECQIAEIPCPELMADLLALARKYKDLELPHSFFDSAFMAVLRLFLEAYPPRYLQESSNLETGPGYIYYRIYHYFDDCIAGEDFSLHGFSANFKCSPRTLTRLCREYLFDSPRSAFLNYRLDCAMSFLLENPGISIKEVSDRFRYPNQFYFSRQFRKRFGFPPSRARRELEPGSMEELPVPPSCHR